MAAWTVKLRDGANNQKPEFIQTRFDANGNVLEKRDTKITKIQASPWGESNPINATFPKDLACGLTYRLANIQVVGSRKNGKDWTGNLIVVLEAKSGTFFHQFIATNKSHKPHAEHIIYLIAKIDAELQRAVPTARQYLNQPRTLWLPEYSGSANSKLIPEIYKTVYEVFIENMNINVKLDANWLKNVSWINLSEWNAHTYLTSDTPFRVRNISAKNCQIKDGREPKNTFETAQNFRNAIHRLAKELNKQYKNKPGLPKKWLSMNPPRSHTRLDQKRFDK